MVGSPDARGAIVDIDQALAASTIAVVYNTIRLAIEASQAGSPSV